MLANAGSQSSLQLVLSSFRATTPQYAIDVDRVKAQALGVTVDQVFNAFGGYLGSAYVNQFTKFGRTFQVFVQADAAFRLRLDDMRNLTVRNASGGMIPLGTLVKITPVVRAVADQPLQSLSVRHHRRHPGARHLDRPGDGADGADRGENPAAACRLRVVGDVLPGEAGRQSDVPGLRHGAAAGLSRARRPIRELVPAAGGDPGGADLADRAGRRAARCCTSTTISTPRSASCC